ncbi:Ig-like domain-containing protein [Paenibacillus sp. SI8]|uniref:Ig-like domain-containing protein n=1 Tax=unclassified Paenibacillus TaxID=185978 RepID=UPI0034653D0F
MTTKTRTNHLFFILGMCIVLLLNLTIPTLGASTEGYTILEEVPGKVVDFDDSRILYVDNNSYLSVRDRSTQLDTSIARVNFYTDKCYLIDNGVVYAKYINNSKYDIYEWNGGTITQLASQVRFFKKAGKFITYGTNTSTNNQFAISLYDTSSRTLYPVSEQNGTLGNGPDISADGHLVYSTNSSMLSGYLVSYFNGVTQMLNIQGSNPKTDGERVLYSRYNNGSAERYELYIYQNQTETLVSYAYDPFSAYELNNGWIAYTAPFSSKIGLRTPAGQTIKITTQDSDNNGLILNKNGELIYNSGFSDSNLFYTNPSMVGNAEAIHTLNGQLYKLIYMDSKEKWYGYAPGYLLEYNFSHEPVQIPVESVDIPPSLQIVMNKKPSAGLNYHLSPTNATNKNVTWETSNPLVATVQDGIVTAVSPGSATIKITTEDGNFSAFSNVHVVIGVTNISVNQSNLALHISESAQIQASIQPSDATDQRIGWDSNDSNIASVDAHGVVTGKSPGTTEIIATSLDGRFTATRSVTVTGNVGKAKFDYNSLLQWADESSSTVTANVYRVGGSRGTLLVDYATENDTASSVSDYDTTRGRLIFEDGETKKTIQIRLINDHKKEPLESFSLKLLGPADALFGPATNRTFFMIRDDD